MAASREQSRRYQAALRAVLAGYRSDYGEDEYRRRLAAAREAVEADENE